MTFKHNLMNNVTKQNKTASAFGLYKSGLIWANIFVSQSLFDYNAVRFLKSTMCKQRMWEMYVEPKQILVCTKCTKT
jgi:hypothetical protein